jgi:hypothetical protein
MPHMAVSGAYLTARWILGAVYRAPAKADHLGGTMGTWFRLNIPLALARWKTELNASPSSR